jgi:hypothetical protein
MQFPNYIYFAIRFIIAIIIYEITIPKTPLSEIAIIIFLVLYSISIWNTKRKKQVGRIFF